MGAFGKSKAATGHWIGADWGGGAFALAWRLSHRLGDERRRAGCFRRRRVARIAGGSWRIVRVASNKRRRGGRDGDKGERAHFPSG